MEWWHEVFFSPLRQPIGCFFHKHTFRDKARMPACRTSAFCDRHPIVCLVDKVAFLLGWKQRAKHSHTNRQDRSQHPVPILTENTRTILSEKRPFQRKKTCQLLAGNEQCCISGHVQSTFIAGRHAIRDRTKLEGEKIIKHCSSVSIIFWLESSFLLLMWNLVRT